MDFNPKKKEQTYEAHFLKLHSQGISEQCSDKSWTFIQARFLTFNFFFSIIQAAECGMTRILIFLLKNGLIHPQNCMNSSYIAKTQQMQVYHDHEFQISRKQQQNYEKLVYTPPHNKRNPVNSIAFYRLYFQASICTQIFKMSKKNYKILQFMD